MTAFAVRKGLSVTRRDVLKQTAAGLTFALTLQADPRTLLGEAAAAEGPLSANIWVTIATDGTISIVSPNNGARPKSTGRMPVRAVAPMRGWPAKPLPAPTSATSKVTGRVLPSSVSSPSTCALCGPVCRKPVDLKLACGKARALR